MSIGTYSELKTAVASFLHRTDLTTQIPDFITLAEARLQRVELLRDMEHETTLTSSQGSNAIALPDGYISPINLWLVISTARIPLVKKNPSDFNLNTAIQSYPEYWAIDGSNLLLDKYAGGAYSLPFRYMKSFSLSNSNPTNYLLTNAPDIYLFTALAEACAYTQEDPSAWEAKAQRAISDYNYLEAKSKQATLGTELYTKRWNIYQGT